MDLKFQVQTKIQKPIDEVFDAVYNPEKLSGYFTNGGASAPLDEGTEVEWRFADNPDEDPISAPVTVKQVIPNELIVIEWEADKGRMTRTEMNFEKAGPDETIVRISESGWQETQDGLNRSYGNCMGWSHMVMCLKAYLEYGINLRKGAYGGLYSAKDHQTGNKDG
jgi:uncharacterized protein YndB with AHSA1/START domain